MFDQLKPGMLMEYIGHSAFVLGNPGDFTCTIKHGEHFILIDIEFFENHDEHWYGFKFSCIFKEKIIKNRFVSKKFFEQWFKIVKTNE